MTDVSIFSALRAGFETKARYSRISPARYGTGGTAVSSSPGDAGDLGRGLVRLDFWARTNEAHTSTAPSITAPRMFRVCFEFARIILSCRSGKTRTLLSLRTSKSG